MLQEPVEPQPPSQLPGTAPEAEDSAALTGLAVEKSDAGSLLAEGAVLGQGGGPLVPGAPARSVLRSTTSEAMDQPAVPPATLVPATAEPDCIQSLDLAGNVLSVNAGGRQILGIADPAGPHLGTSWAEQWRGAGIDEASRAVAQARAGRTVHFEASLATVVGFSKLWEATLSPVPGLDGEPERLLAVMRAVVNQPPPDLARSGGSDAQFRAAFDQATVGIVSIDTQGRVLWANEAFCTMVGYPPEELIGRDSRGYTHPDDIRQNSASIQRIQEAALPRTTFEKRYLHKDGHTVWAHINLAPVRDSSGCLTSLIGVAEDVTERHQSREELAKVQVRLDAALTAGEIGTWVWEIPIDRVSADKNLCRLFFVPPDVMAEGAPLETFTRSIHPEDRAKASADIGDAVARGGTFETAYRVVGPAGEIRWLAARGNVETDSAGRGSRFYGVVLDITARKQAEQALAATAEELAQQTRIFNTALSATEDFAYLFDLEGRFIYANRPLLEVWGKSLSEIVGKTCFELGYPDWHAEMHQREIRQVIETRRPVNGEVPFTGANGRTGRYDYTFTPVFSASGQVEAIAGTTHDITLRLQAEEALRASKERLALVIEAAQFGTFDWSLTEDPPKIEWNDRLRGFFWLPPDVEVTRELFHGIIHPEDRQRVVRALDAAVEHGDIYDNEYRLLGPDGQVRWIRGIGRSFRDESGKPVRYGGISIDITRQKQAEDELRASEARFRQLADSMPQIVWAAKPDGILDYSNRRWLEYIDQPEGSGHPDTWAGYVYPDDLPGAGLAWAAALKDGSLYATEFRLRRADGAYRWFLVRALPIRDASGAIFRWYGTCTDIHDQKEFQSEREDLLNSERAARSEAERASQMKDEFLSTLSHELRTPLNAILGWAQVLRSPAAPPGAETVPAPLDPDLEMGLATIERNARSQAQIIEDLLDMSRIISGKVRLDVQRVDLAPVVQAAIDTMQPAAEAKGIRLQAILDPVARPVSGDPNRLQQVFWNILSNAIKFTPRGGRVQIVLQRINSHLEVVFNDSGEGIPAGFLPHVFDRFRQADATSTRRHGGLGLGLAIVKQLVELHGGSVRAASAGPGTGASFIVSLPLMVAVETSSPAPPGAGGATVQPVEQGGAPNSQAADERRHPQAPGFAALKGEVLGVDLRGLRVLVVDDEPDARALLKRLMEERGAEVLVGGSAEEAYALAMNGRPDVLVSDIGMPGQDGYTLIRRIRAQEALDTAEPKRKKLPAVALTAYARAEDRMKAVLAGFQMHVSKPVEAAELLAMVASLTGRT